MAKRGLGYNKPKKRFSQRAADFADCPCSFGASCTAIACLKAYLLSPESFLFLKSPKNHCAAKGGRQKVITKTRRRLAKSDRKREKVTKIA